MAPSVEISIPNTQLSATTKPYTIYNISLRQAIRSFIVQKRYSEFTSLHDAITSEAGSPPPVAIPAKSWFSRTILNPELTEQRRQGLEKYLRAVNENVDARWRDTSAWRTFLNLPSNLGSKSSVATNLHNKITSTAPLTDPVVWLDCHGDLKKQLHDARLQLTKRDQAQNPQAQHESSANAKKCLVKAGSLIQALDAGLKGQDDWGTEKLGEGELRRRKDLVASARKEKDSLETLLNAIVAKARVDATVEDKKSLLSSNANGSSSSTPASAVHRSGRVLGKETTRTRELDNQGVLQLQKQMMHEQDEDVEVLAKAVRRQKELAVAIAEETEVQVKMLEMLDEDVTRVGGKVDVARKRVNKIS
ncbi:MAG: hypothetical protein MMC33_001457 [Icmadophila ericetorum]|nr:hypothetical protein [Icmadophila ericetorum]